jgi:hypothetical protein
MYLNNSIWWAQKEGQEKTIVRLPNSPPFYASVVFWFYVEIGDGNGQGRLDWQ